METVIVIDNHVDSADVLSFFVGASEYRVLTFNSFHDALRSVDIENPCIILMDVAVPGELMAGDFVLIARHAHPSVKILILSGLSEGHEIADSIGADGWLKKPYDLDKVLRIVADHCPRDGTLKKVEVENVMITVAQKELSLLNYKLQKKFLMLKIHLARDDASYKLLLDLERTISETVTVLSQIHSVE